MHPTPETLVIRFLRDHTHVTDQGAMMPFTAPEFYAVPGVLAEDLVKQGIACLHDVQHQHNTLSAADIAAFNELHLPKPPPPEPEPEIQAALVNLLQPADEAIDDAVPDHHKSLDDKSAEQSEDDRSAEED